MDIAAHLHLAFSNSPLRLAMGNALVAAQTIGFGIRCFCFVNFHRSRCGIVAAQQQDLESVVFALSLISRDRMQVRVPNRLLRQSS